MCTGTSALLQSRIFQAVPFSTAKVASITAIVLFIFKFSSCSSDDISYSIFQNTNLLTSSFLFTRLKPGDRLKLVFVASVSAGVRHES